MRKYDFPAIHITETGLHMNPGAAQHFKDAQALRLRIKSNMLLLEPAPRYGRDALSLRHDRGCAKMNLPNDLKARNMTGYYRLYKAGPLYAIKRDERMVG